MVGVAGVYRLWGWEDGPPTRPILLLTNLHHQHAGTTFLLLVKRALNNASLLLRGLVRQLPPSHQLHKTGQLIPALLKAWVQLSECGWGGSSLGHSFLPSETRKELCIRT